MNIDHLSLMRCPAFPAFVNTSSLTGIAPRLKSNVTPKSIAKNADRCLSEYTQAVRALADVNRRVDRPVTESDGLSTRPIQVICSYLARSPTTPEDRGQVWLSKPALSGSGVVAPISVSCLRQNVRTLMRLRQVNKQYCRIVSEFLIFDLLKIVFRVMPLVYRSSTKASRSDAVDSSQVTGSESDRVTALKLDRLVEFLRRYPNLGGLRLRLYSRNIQLIDQISSLTRILKVYLRSVLHVSLELPHIHRAEEELGKDKVQRLIRALSGRCLDNVCTVRLEGVTLKDLDLGGYGDELKCVSLLGCDISHVHFRSLQQLDRLELSTSAAPFFRDNAAQQRAAEASVRAYANPSEWLDDSDLDYDDDGFAASFYSPTTHPYYYYPIGDTALQHDHTEEAAPSSDKSVPSRGRTAARSRLNTSFLTPPDAFLQIWKDEEDEVPGNLSPSSRLALSTSLLDGEFIRVRTLVLLNTLGSRSILSSVHNHIRGIRSLVVIDHHPPAPPTRHSLPPLVDLGAWDNSLDHLVVSRSLMKPIEDEASEPDLALADGPFRLEGREMDPIYLADDAATRKMWRSNAVVL